MIQIQEIPAVGERLVQEVPPSGNRLFLVRGAIPKADSQRPEEYLLALQANQSGGLVRLVEWVEDLAATNQLVFVYAADSEASVRRHTESSGLRASEIVELKRRIDARAA